MGPTPPVTPRDAGAWLVIAVVGFVVGQVAALFLLEVVAAGLGDSARLGQIATMSAPPVWYVASSLVGLWVGFFGAPWLASRVRGTGRPAADLGVRFRPVDLVGVVVGAGGQVVVSALYAPFVNHLHNFEGPTNRLTGGAHGAGFLLVAVLTVVGAPFMEELFFRGLLLRGLLRLLVPVGAERQAARRLGLVGAVVLDAVLFGLAHGEVEQFAGLALFGAALAYVSYRTGRQGMNMVAHATFNLLAVVSVELSRGVVH